MRVRGCTPQCKKACSRNSRSRRWTRIRSLLPSTKVTEPALIVVVRVHTLAPWSTVEG